MPLHLIVFWVSHLFRGIVFMNQSVKINLEGRRFGRLLVLKEAYYNDRQRTYMWRCLCDCGVEKIIRGSTLRTGASKSCGCLFKEKRALSRVTHRQTKSYTYVSWSSMKTRCLTTSDKSYKNYGGRGILICERWHSFDNFMQDMGVRPLGTTLERIDVNGNYEPNNCKWATRVEQNRNTRNSRWLGYNGEKMILIDWARRLGISQTTISRNLKKMSFSDVVSKFQNIT